MPDREKVIAQCEWAIKQTSPTIIESKTFYEEVLALLKDDETRIQYLNDHIAMCKEEVERLYKEQENASKRNPVIVCPHCGKRVK